MIFAFEVSVKDSEFKDIINSISRNKAKSEFWNRINDCYEIPFTSIRVRKIGKAISSDAFVRNAKYRGKNDFRCGDKVRVGSDIGFIVGHNSSANFNVQFVNSSKYGNLVLNVHPCSVEKFV